jgi:hypothetical protein
MNEEPKQRGPVMHCPECGHSQIFDVRNHAESCSLWKDTSAWHPEWSRYCLAPYGDVCPLHG